MDAAGLTFEIIEDLYDLIVNSAFVEVVRMRMAKGHQIRLNGFELDEGKLSGLIKIPGIG